MSMTIRGADTVMAVSQKKNVISAVRGEQTMDDLIKRSDAIDAIDDVFDGIPMEQTYEILKVRKTIRELPSADRPQGEWIEDRYVDSEWISPRADFFRCSICGKRVNLFQMRVYNYCPSCGARMKRSR